MLALRMDNNNNPPKKDFIDFRTLSERELINLSNKWEQDARVFEYKLEGYKSKPNPNEEKLERLWTVGKKLWRRLQILEDWRMRQKNKFLAQRRLKLVSTN